MYPEALQLWSLKIYIRPEAFSLNKRVRSSLIFASGPRQGLRKYLADLVPLVDMMKTTKQAHRKTD